MLTRRQLFATAVAALAWACGVKPRIRFGKK